MASNSDNTLLLLGLGGLGLYLYLRSEEEKAAALAAQQGGSLGVGPVVGIPVAGQSIPPQGTPVTPTAAAGTSSGPHASGWDATTDPIQNRVGTILAVGQPIETTVVGAVMDRFIPGSGALAPIAVAGAHAGLQEDIQAAEGIFSNPLSLSSVGGIAELSLAPGIPFSKIGSAIADAFGWSGKPLDQVNDIILSALGNGNTDNVGIGPKYAMDSSGTLHEIQADITQAQYSWREIIAVDQSVIDKFQKGNPITSRSQIDPVPRPIDPDLLRQALGFDAIFKLGNSNTLYGPGKGASTSTLVGVHDGAPEGTGAVYQVLHPWEGGDYNLHPVGRSWKRHIGSPQALYNHGWSFNSVLWVDETSAAMVPTFGPDLMS